MNTALVYWILPKWFTYETTSFCLNMKTASYLLKRWQVFCALHCCLIGQKSLLGHDELAWASQNVDHRIVHLQCPCIHNVLNFHVCTVSSRLLKIQCTQIPYNRTSKMPFILLIKLSVINCTLNLKIHNWNISTISNAFSHDILLHVIFFKKNDKIKFLYIRKILLWFNKA